MNTKIRLSRQNDESPFMVPNLDRGLSVLEILGRHPNGLIASDIADHLGVPRNSMGRILATMVDRGYLGKDDKTKAYKLTKKLLSLGSSVVCEQDIIEESLDAMRSLRDVTTETVLLSVMLDGEGVVIDQMPARHTVRLMVDPGSRFELHCSAPGKLHIGYLPGKERKSFLKSLKLSKHTNSTITSRETLADEIDQAVRQGHAFDRGEGIYGANCVSAPIFDRNGRCVAALTVTGFSERVPEKDFPKLAVTVKEHAARISKRLGYDGR
jgi:DNA-binding IclR family transcriptional regulator